MNKIVLESLNENKKPIIYSLLGIVISIVLILFTINTSYYLAFLSVPIAIITVFLFIQTIKQVSIQTLEDGNMQSSLFRQF